MAAFAPRTTAPDADDRHWIHTTNGGVNECIEIVNGSVLPNCVGYAWGRVYELLGHRPTLSRANAENWYGFTADGYERGQTPKLGSVVCWRKGQAGNGTDGAGHVAVVEEVCPDGTVLCSNSAYKGQRFYLKRIDPKTWPGGAYVFQGYIHPNYAFATPPTERIGTTVERDTSKHQVEVQIDDLRVRKRPELCDDVILGFATPGRYDVTEVRDMRGEASNGYVWYRIGDDRWIAAKEGDWTVDLPAEASPFPSEEDVQTLRAALARVREENETLHEQVETLTAKGEVLEVLCDDYAARLRDIRALAAI